MYTSTIYYDIHHKIVLFKWETFIYFLGFLLSILILRVLLEIDLESYFYHEGQRINVSHLLGYDFKSIHQKKLKKNVSIYGFSILLLVAIIFVTNYFSYLGFYTPRDGWTNGKLIIGVLISILFSGVLLILEIKKLKRKEKNLVIQIKEES